MGMLANHRIRTKPLSALSPTLGRYSMNDRDAAAKVMSCDVATSNTQTHHIQLCVYSTYCTQQWFMLFQP